MTHDPKAVTAGVEAYREKGYAAARANLQEAWAAMALIRETIETLGPVGAVKASEHLDGPTFMHEAEALVAGIVALSRHSVTDCPSCHRPMRQNLSFTCRNVKCGMFGVDQKASSQPSVKGTEA